MSETTDWHPENQYLNLIRNIIAKGEKRNTRNADTVSLFGQRLEFNIIEDGFPLLTTKRVFWRGVVEELLWFLRGETDAKKLAEKGVHIWDANSTREFLDSRGLTYEEGMCGPIYGYSWRKWGACYPDGNNGIDQLKDVIEQLQNNPTSRRMILSAWNPSQNDEMCLPACHTLYQFYKNENGISVQLTARSQDTILGTPFNIASTALLATILGHLFEVPVERVIICMGDAHVYVSHIQNAVVQLERKPYDFPKVKITRKGPGIESSLETKLQWIEELQFSDFELINYQYHGPLKFEMIA